MQVEHREFENGEYAHWIKEFQRRDPRTISFSNRLTAINRAGSFKIISLNPLMVESELYKVKDLTNISLLTDYFDYLKLKANNKDAKKLVISVDEILYALYDETTHGERVISVMDINDSDTTYKLVEIV